MVETLQCCDGMGEGSPFFAILRAALLCVRGSCTKWRSLGIVDGASLPITAAE